MLGAVFTILTNISWQPYTDLLAKTGLGQLFTGVQNVTTNLLAVYMAFAVGYRGATVFGNKKIYFNIRFFIFICLYVTYSIR